MISFLTTSFMFGLSRRCLSTMGLEPSSQLILCLQKSGLIPGISEVFHAKARLCFLRTETSLSF